MMVKKKKRKKGSVKKTIFLVGFFFFIDLPYKARSRWRVRITKKKIEAKHNKPNEMKGNNREKEKQKPYTKR